MAKGAKKGGKVRDKWRDKQWVVVNKPAGFEPSGPVNYIPITDIERAEGRVIENTMFDVMKGSGREGDASLHVIKVYLQIDKITDGTASTIFRGHEYAKEFLRSLVRRGSSMVTFTNDYTTMDGHTFRVASIAFTQRRVNSSKKHEIRMIAHKLLSERIPQLTVDQFVQELTGAKGEDIPRETNSKLGSDILESVKRITAVRHVGIKKTKLISTPESRAVQDAKPVESAQPAS